MPNRRQTSSSKTKEIVTTMSGTNWIVFAASILFLVIAGLLVVFGLDEVGQFTEQSARRTSVSDAEVYAAAENVSRSGVIESWEIAYEFLADGVSGSDVSIHARSDWIKKEKIRSETLNVPIRSVVEHSNLPPAPAGKSFFLKLDTLSAEDYDKIGLGIAQVKYDPEFPDNSWLAEKSPPSFSRLYVLAPFMGTVGGVLFLIGVWGCFARRNDSSEAKGGDLA